MKYTLDSLAEIIAQVVDFSIGDFGFEQELPEYHPLHLGFVVACFLAQHTKEGHHGVDTETGMVLLQTEDRTLDYPARVNLARKAIAEFGGVK